MEGVLLALLYLFVVIVLGYAVYLMAKPVFKALCSLTLSVGLILLVLWLLGKIL